MLLRVGAIYTLDMRSPLQFRWLHIGLAKKCGVMAGFARIYRIFTNLESNVPGRGINYCP